MFIYFPLFLVMCFFAGYGVVNFIGDLSKVLHR